MNAAEKPRKFRVNISERIIKGGCETHGKGFAKTIDLDDVKSIYELLKTAKTYSEKYGQNTKRLVNLEL